MAFYSEVHSGNNMALRVRIVVSIEHKLNFKLICIDKLKTKIPLTPS